MEHRRRWYRRILIGFFLFMLAGTLISRIYDSMTVPKVLTAYAKRKSVETIISGTGTVKERETVLCDIFPGLKVESVSVSAGSEVKTGDELFHFQMASVLEEKESLEEELQRAQLNLQRLGVASETYAAVTQTELAQRELALAQQALAEGQKEYDAQWAEHFVNRKNLDAEYERKRTMSDDELILSQEQQLASAEKELRNARSSRDGQIQEKQQEIDELKAKIEAAKGGSPSAPVASGANAAAGIAGAETSAGNAGSSAGADTAALEKQLAAAQRELEELKGQWELTISDIRYRYDTLSIQYDRLMNGETTAQEALRDSYEADLKQEDAEEKAGQDALEALTKSPGRISRRR